MSDAATSLSPPRPPGPPEVASLLSAVPLFRGASAEQVADIATAFEVVQLEAGAVVWRQAGAVEGLHVLVSGEAQVCRRLPGEREIEIARLRPGDVMGEIPLLGGGTHSATVRTLTPATLLFLDRSEFTARMLSGLPGAVALHERIVAIVCDRLRRVHRTLASAPPIDGYAVPAPAAIGERVRPAVAPELAYLMRLALLRALRRDDVASLLELGEVLDFPRGAVVVEQGAPAERFYLTLNGAVEDVLRRAPSSLRVGLAGPGRAFGYLGLFDGLPVPTTAVARERARVFALDAADFHALLQVRDERSRAFRAAVESDLIATLRNATSLAAVVVA
jgi:CRP-like cAMP-binding protein